MTGGFSPWSKFNAHSWSVLNARRHLAVKNFKNAPNNRANAIEEMKKLERTMTPQQLADGLKLADNFVPLKQTSRPIGDPHRDK
jgi:hypothetical protein